MTEMSSWTTLISQTPQPFLSTTNGTSTDNKSDWKIFEGLLLICICIFAVSGNTLLCTIILRTRSLRNNSNYLILCLSTSDIVVAVVNMPMTIYAIFYGSWPFSGISCVVLGYINMVSFVASVMSLTAISINRYFRICRSLQFKSMFTFRKTLLMGLVVWVVSLLLAAPPLGGWGEYRFLENQSFCFCNWKLSQSYTFFMIGICFCVPCLVMSFCYVRIIKSVRKSNRRLMSLDQRLSASFADMESDNPQSDLPSASSKMPDIPEKLKAFNANGTRIIVDPLCARKLTDYAKTLKQSIELQKKGLKGCNIKDVPEDNNQIESGLRSPPSQRNLGPYTININEFNFSPSPESESGDNLDGGTSPNLTNGSLKNRNLSYDTILTVSSPEMQSQDDLGSDRGENGDLCVRYGNNKSSEDEQRSGEMSPSTVDSISSPCLQRKVSDPNSETEKQNNNLVQSSDEMLEAESAVGSGDEGGDEADEEKEVEEVVDVSERQLARCVSDTTESNSKMDEEMIPCSLCGRSLDRDVPCGCWARRTPNREKSKTFPTSKMPVLPCRNNKRITISDSSRHRKHKKVTGKKRSNPMKKTFSLSQVKFNGTGRKSTNAVPSRYLRRRREEIRITFSLLVVIIVFFVSWLPFCITMLCSLYCTVPRAADIISLFFGYANSCFNPLIYGLMNRRFSDAYKLLFKSMFYGKCIKR